MIPACFAFVLVALGEVPAPQGIALRFEHPAKGFATFEVHGLAERDLARLVKADWKPSQWSSLFGIYVANSELKNPPPMLGSYLIDKGILRFEPRFPPSVGLRYRAVFDPAKLPGGGKGNLVRAEFELPKPKPGAAAVVERVYPTRNHLPENQLKFYLHFSSPMSRGEAYRRICLLTEKGKVIELPFLELDEELWDPQGKRFTLFFDPGRIKRGLKPREELGPALEEGKTYILEIDRHWLDADGNPLKETFRKTFRVDPPDDEPIEPKKWKIETPASGTKSPVTVTFPEPLDSALLQRLLWVIDDRGRRLSGSVELSNEETCWRFTPDRSWPVGAYRLVVDTTLEDLAGNSVGRPFEVDVFRPIRREIKTKTVEMPFTIP